MDQRPKKWPFHDHPPENVEADVEWIFDWTSKEANAYLGRENGPADWAVRAVGQRSEEEHTGGTEGEDGQEEEVYEDELEVEDGVG
jgi:hypothetical protein